MPRNSLVRDAIRIAVKFGKSFSRLTNTLPSFVVMKQVYWLYHWALMRRFQATTFESEYLVSRHAISTLRSLEYSSTGRRNFNQIFGIRISQTRFHHGLWDCQILSTRSIENCQKKHPTFAQVFCPNDMIICEP